MKNKIEINKQYYEIKINQYGEKQIFIPKEITIIKEDLQRVRSQGYQFERLSTIKDYNCITISDD